MPDHKTGESSRELSGTQVKEQPREGEQQRREARSLRRTLQAVSDSLERAQIADYVQLLNTPKRLMLLNFLAGLFRGIGMAVGFTLLTALLIYVLTRSFISNLPLIGDFFGELVWIIQQYLRGKS